MKQDNVRMQIFSEIRRRPRTAAELAQRFSMTPSAVRNHLLKLEQNGLILVSSLREDRVGQPSKIYSLNPEQEDAFSQVYKPFLVQLLKRLPDSISESEMELLFKDIGLDLAGNEKIATGTLLERVRQVSDTLTQVGAVIDISENDNEVSLTSYACPLAEAVHCRPQICKAVESFIASITAAKVTEHCQRNSAPLVCRFRILDKKI